MMNFIGFQSEAFSDGEVIRALEELQGFYPTGENRGIDEDDLSETFGSLIFSIPSNDASLENIQTTLTEYLMYDDISDGHVFFRMDTVVCINESGDSYDLCIDHSPEGEFDDTEYED